MYKLRLDTFILLRHYFSYFPSILSPSLSLSVKVGTVWVNCWLVRDLNVPFGGAKMSGVGREGLKDSLEFYTEVKTVCIKH